MCLIFNGFCFCFSLDTGTKVISLISIVTSATIIILYGTSVMLLPYLPPARVAFYWCMTFAGLLQLASACLLLYAAFKKRPKLMSPWVMVSWSTSVAVALLAAGGAALVVYQAGTPAAGEASAVISIYFVYAVILFYFASVVHSRRQELQCEEESESAKRLMRPVAIPNHYVV